MKHKTCTDYWLNTVNMTLRGEFEEMYQDIDDPWGCNGGTNSLNNKIFLEIIFDERAFKRILDIGCGIGGLTNQLYRRNKGGGIVGCDISQTAISKASNLYPYINFRVKNILLDDIADLGLFDLITLSEIVWYILDAIDDVFKKLCKSLTESGTIGIHQYFPSNQTFGKDIINGLQGFESFIEEKTDFYICKKIISCHDEGKVLLATLKRRI